MADSAPRTQNNAGSKVSTDETIWTLGSLLDWTAKHLADKAVESPRLDVEVLLAHAAGCKRIDLYGMRFEEVASAEVRQTFRELIRKRLQGCPVAYLVGKKEFFGLEFQVDSAVLIPRPDSEHLVSECLQIARPLANPRILDIGTGSGALAVAIAKKLPAAQVTAIDISEAALNVARGNADKFGVADRVEFLQSDLFDAIPREKTFDVILSNPPYIPTADISTLAVGVRDFEPHLALDGGASGFHVFERIVAMAPAYLSASGYLLVEIGAPQEEHCRQVIERTAACELLPTVHDYAGHARVLISRKK